MKKIKVFLVDDHDILMDGIEAILKDVANLVVVGKANSVDTAQELIKISVPDLILTDISLGEKSGLDLTKYVKKEYPQVWKSLKKKIGIKDAESAKWKTAAGKIKKLKNPIYNISLC